MERNFKILLDNEKDVNRIETEILNIRGEDVEETPTFGAKLNTEYILGMAKMEGGVKILLEIDKVLTNDELSLLKKAA